MEKRKFEARFTQEEFMKCREDYRDKKITKEEIFKLLRNGKSLSEALNLHEIGFKTVDEVIEYAGAIPESWIDLILN